ncbi:MAG: hypothetical protein K2J95_07870 [Lachnospiraceae bacterium]|nr:hypothetical protein [Lachnospiraceae bacterium]
MILETDDAWKKIKNSLQEADKVLIGIGTELQFTEDGDVQRCRNAYANLRGKLEGKDYFVISLCMDDMIYTSFSREENIVCPCGGLMLLQCVDACTKELYPVRELCAEAVPYLEKVQWKYAEDMLPVCPKCGKPLTFNNIRTENYLEEGYLEQWGQYKTWLQSTINRRLCMIELGVGMQYPSVIRWAFDKLAFYNQKAEFYRIHTTLYQHTKENGERGYSIKEHGLNFLLSAN